MSHHVLDLGFDGICEAFWTQVAIVALLSGYDRIGEAHEEYGASDNATTLSDFLDVACRVVQEFINPRTR